MKGVRPFCPNSPGTLTFSKLVSDFNDISV